MSRCVQYAGRYRGAGSCCKSPRRLSNAAASRTLEKTLAALARILAPLLFLGVAACGGGAEQDPSVSDAWIRLPVVPGRPGAAYFTLVGGSKPTRLVSVEGPAAERIELHSSSMAGGHMTMERLDGVTLDKGAKVSFAPEGNHAMLFGVSPTLKPGDRTRLTFRFEKGTPVTAEAKVVAAGGD